jgi:toxin YoeB
MAKKIIWSLTADKDRQQIIEYWINRNKSNTYSLKLDAQFRELIKLIAETPEIGISTNLTSVRFVISGNYLIYY